HAGEDGLGHVVRSREVHGQVELPVGVAHVLELGHGEDNPRVVDADVDGTEVALCRGDRRPDLRDVADVAGVAAGDPARGLDGPGRLPGALGVEVEDRHAAALGGQYGRVGLAEAPSAAGDDRHASLDAEVHVTSP